MEWTVLLPDGKIEHVRATGRSSARGVVQLLCSKPEQFLMDTALLSHEGASIGSWVALPNDAALLAIDSVRKGVRTTFRGP